MNEVDQWRVTNTHYTRVVVYIKAQWYCAVVVALDHNESSFSIISHLIQMFGVARLAEPAGAPVTFSPVAQDCGKGLVVAGASWMAYCPTCTAGQPLESGLCARKMS